MHLRCTNCKKLLFFAKTTPPFLSAGEESMVWEGISIMTCRNCGQKMGTKCPSCYSGVLEVKSWGREQSYESFKRHGSRGLGTPNLTEDGYLYRTVGCNRCTYTKTERKRYRTGQNDDGNITTDYGWTWESCT